MTKALQRLHVAPNLFLPIDAVTGTHVVYGRKRKGKTYKAKVLAEEMLQHRQQIIVIDPTDAWWGLRSSSDGASAGYPITIFGGRHADLPLEATAGEELADAVAEDDFSAIFSLKGMTRANEQRFCYSFLERLFRKNPQKPLHIFMDEADIYAPQTPFGEEARTLGATQNMVRRGGLDGLGMTLITQRPAVLAKSVSSQCDTLISVCLNSPHDIKQVEDWIQSSYEDRDIAKRVIADLPTLGRPENIGIAWVLSPDRDISARVTFRELHTFDSGRTPKVGEKRRVPRVLSPVDLEHLGKRIAATVERAKESDPKHLRVEIVRLKSELAAAKPATPPVVKMGKPAKAEPIVTGKQLAAMEKIQAESSRLSLRFDALGNKLEEIVEVLRRGAGDLLNSSTLLRHAVLDVTNPRPIAQPSQFAPNRALSTKERLPEGARGGSPTSPRDAVGGAGSGTSADPGVTAGETAPPSGMDRKFLVCLAQERALNGRALTKRQILVRTGYADGGYTSRAFARLTKAGWIAQGPGLVTITDDGVASLGAWEPLPVGHELFLHVMRGPDLGEMEKSFLEAIQAAWPKPIAKSEVRGSYKDGGYTARGFSRLVTLGYAKNAGGGSMILAEELAP